MNWLDHPAFQGGVAPLVVALIVAALLASTQGLSRTTLAWLAILAGYIAATYLATSLSLTPLNAARKVTLTCIAAAFVGVALDFSARPSTALRATVAVVAGAVAIWCFWSIVGQRDAAGAAILAAGIAIFAAAATWLMLRLADDGIRAAAAGVGLGIATGIAAVISASIGYLLSGMAVAAGSGALLLVQVLGRRDLRAGFAAALTIGLPCALFAIGAMLQAQMPWFALPLLLLVPLVVAVLRFDTLGRMARASVLVAIAVVIGLIPIAAAWYAARASLS